MAAPRLTLRLVLPVLLITLVVVLGALQYRWLGQVSEAERAQLGRSLSQRANEFGVEFDREIGLASSMLAIDAEALEQDPWAALGARYDGWRERAMAPAIVRTIYVARGDEGTHTLARWTPDTRTGSPAEWPEHLAPVRRALSVSQPRIVGPSGSTTAYTASQTGSVFTMTVSPVHDAVPALVIPIVSRPTRLPSESDMVVAVRFASTDFLIVELDHDAIVHSLIPALVERFFPAEDASRYRVAIVDRTLTPVYQRGFADGIMPEHLHVDATAHFFAGARSEFNARLVTETRNLMWETVQRRTGTAVTVPAAGAASNATGPSATAAARARTEIQRMAPVSPGISVFVQERTPAGTLGVQPSRIALGGWQLFLQHGAGSLDEAVARARTRNLATSFGILGVLLAGVALIVANARKSERLAAQQMEFVATVSHELRTPLAVIRSAGQNLSAGVVDDPAQTRRYGQLIETEGRRLTDMVEEVLEFAGLSGNRRPLALRPVDVAGLVDEVVAAHEQALTAGGMTVASTADEPLPPVMADEDALRRALSNLIGNAIKYAADGRWIGIHLARETHGDASTLVITVADRGPGIAPEDAKRIFEPFYRGRTVVDRQIHGNGLGLSLVARIAEAHGGTVDVTPTAGGGATFTLRFPAVDVPAHE